VVRSRTSTAWLFLWCGLIFLALRPVPAVTHAVDVLLAPARWASALGSPLGLVATRRVSAAERSLARAAPDEAREGKELLELLARRALPGAEELRAGRRFLLAEVIERPSKDECWVRLAELAGARRGAPVVSGEAFVGRVVELRPPDLARVRLVTERGFRVGAEVRGAEPDRAEPVYLTVGGVLVPRRGEPRTVRLAAYQPSSSVLDGGVARVHELLADAEDATGLAEGFRLGRVHRRGERGDVWIEPELDYLDGLFQVAVLAPVEGVAPPPRAVPSALEDGQWVGAEALTSGDPSPWRSTRKVGLGVAEGLRVGAAVTGAGAHLVGRVTRVGLGTSDVALLDDPGFSLAAVARVEGQGEPCILGRLTTLGRTEDGRIRVHWAVRLTQVLGPGDGGAESPAARLYSGSGDPGLPAGLFLGRVVLPARVEAGEERELVLDPLVAPADVRRLFVRRETRGDGA